MTLTRSALARHNGRSETAWTSDLSSRDALLAELARIAAEEDVEYPVIVTVRPL